MVRKFVLVASSIFSLVLLIFANLIPYKRIWGNEEIYVRSDALLVVMVMLFMSAFSSIIGICIAKKHKAKVLFLVILFVNIIFIFQGYVDDMKYIGV